MTLGDAAPAVRSPIPASAGKEWIERLAASECPALTTRRRRRAEQTGSSHDPIVWVEARGDNVVDADGNRYVDLTSGFGAAFVGHSHPEIVDAVQRQAGTLIHALGDLHPSNLKVELLERLCQLAPWDDARAMLSLSGADAITAALKTAVLATGKPGVVAFDGGYHGLAYAPLSVSGYAERFAAPFAEQLGPRAHFAKWPDDPSSVTEAIESLPANWDQVGALVVEPVQGRGGVRIPPPGFLRGLRETCTNHGVVVIADEILTGLGRCGTWWRSISEDLAPDLICIGKALGGGLPVSACIGREAVMRAWGNPDKEAIHTGTFFGDPLGAAAALATLRLIEDQSLVHRADERGGYLRAALVAAELPGVLEIRQAGMMIGLQLRERLAALSVARSLLERGYLVLPAGADADVIELLPSVFLSDARISEFVETLSDVFGANK